MQSFQSDESIETVIEKYMKLVFGIALTYTKNRTDAEDVFQEVFLIYFRKNVSYHDEQHRKAWLINTVVNCSKKVISRNFKKKTIPLEDADDKIIIFNTDEENDLFISLCKIPSKYRTVLHLFYFEDMSVSDIGSMLNLKSGTVKVQLTRGRELLRNELKGENLYE